MIRLSGIAKGFRRPLKEQEEVPVDAAYHREQLAALVNQMETFEEEYARALEQAYESSPQSFYESYRTNLTRYMNNVAKQFAAIDKQLQNIDATQRRMGIQ